MGTDYFVSRPTFIFCNFCHVRTRNSTVSVLAVDLLLTQCYCYYGIILHYIRTANLVLLLAMLIIGN